MKTKEEIEQLAEKYYSQITLSQRTAFKFGYTQCQVDMQKDVEYWQSESDHWHEQAMEMSNKYNELLNKKDNE
jgi:hypothetical protein